VLAAVCAPQNGVGPDHAELNTGVVNLFLEQFSRELPAGVHAVLIWDGAGFHTGAELVVAEQCEPDPTATVLAELNPVENLWHYLRAHHWSNRRYQDYNELQEAAARSLCAVCGRNRDGQKRLPMLRISKGAHEIPGKRIMTQRRTIMGHGCTTGHSQITPCLTSSSLLPRAKNSPRLLYRRWEEKGRSPSPRRVRQTLALKSG